MQEPWLMTLPAPGKNTVTKLSALSWIAGPENAVFLWVLHPCTWEDCWGESILPWESPPSSPFIDSWVLHLIQPFLGLLVWLIWKTLGDKPSASFKHSAPLQTPWLCLVTGLRHARECLSMQFCIGVCLWISGDVSMCSCVRLCACVYLWMSEDVFVSSMCDHDVSECVHEWAGMCVCVSEYVLVCIYEWLGMWVVCVLLCVHV